MAINPISVNPGLQPELKTPVIETTQETEAATSQPAYTPLWQVNDSFGSNAFEMLGMRMPNAGGDVAALLAQVQLTLEQSIDESRKNESISRLSTLVAAFSTYDLEALGKTVERRRKAVDDATDSYNQLVAQTGTLTTQIANENTKIAGYHSQISSLQSQLQNPKLTPAERASLESQLATAQNNLATSLATRESLDIQLAQVKIANLDDQISDLEAQLAAAPADSDEADEIAATLQEKRAEVTTYRAELSAFQSGPKTESARNAFSQNNLSELNSMKQDLQSELVHYNAKKAEAITALQDATYFALALAALATATYVADRAGTINEQTARDGGIETSFERLAEELMDAGERMTNMLKNLEVRQDQDAEAFQRQKIEQFGQGLLASIASILSALEGIDADAPSVPPAGRPQANRTRLDI